MQINPTKAIAGTAIGHNGPPCLALANFAVVWMVRVEVADVLPGVTLAGRKLAEAFAGSPLAVSATGAEKVPFCAATVTV